jgi:hypothetical protein
MLNNNDCSRILDIRNGFNFPKDVANFLELHRNPSVSLKPESLDVNGNHEAHFLMPPIFSSLLQNQLSKNPLKAKP